MKTLQEIYTEIMGSEELKKAFAEAAKSNKVADFLKTQGCEATAEEIKAFLKEKASAQLSDEELDSVAGGTCNDTTTRETFMSVFAAGMCAFVAIVSATDGTTGQVDDKGGRLCSLE